MSSQGQGQDMPEENLPERQEAAGGEVAKHDDPFADPGLPPHEHRRFDVDKKAANRAERQVAFMFLLSMLGTVGFIAAFVAIPKEEMVYIFPLGNIGAQNFALGMTLGVALFFIGAAAVHWARTLMSDEEMVEDRHDIAASEEMREEVFADFRQGTAESAFGRRKLIRTTMVGALALVPLAGVVLLRDLGPLPEKKLRETSWKKGLKLVNQNTGEPIRPADILVGSLTFAMPEGVDPHGEHYHEHLAKDPLIILRLKPEDIKDKQELDWSHEGIVAFSKICTHVGCPVSLYEQQTHHLLCPCHQSTFDMTDGAKVIFGPAGHALPQLQIEVDKDGDLAAMGDFAEPVGPAFWERG